MASVPLPKKADGATGAPHSTASRSKRSSRLILKCSLDKSRTSTPALPKPKAPLALTRLWRHVQAQIEFMVHQPPPTGEIVVGGVARVLEALRRDDVAGYAVKALPGLADQLQQIVLRAPEEVPALEATMNRILAALPPIERDYGPLAK